MIRRLLLSALLLLAATGPCAQLCAWQADSVLENDDTRLIAGLRIRRLFDLAETHCREMLGSDQPGITGQATFTIELIKTQTARAILSSGAQRESAWRNATDTAAQFSKKYPQHPRRFLVEIQSALAHLAHGRLIAQELAADMAPESARSQALEELRTARSILSRVQREIEKAIPEARGKTLEEGEISAAELLALNRNVRYQLAIANSSRAQLYASDDRLNRIDALNDVLQRLTEVQRETSQGQPLWWESRILRIECLRLLGRQSEAQSELSRLSTSLPDSESVPQSLMVQQLKLALDSGNPMVATSALEKAAAIPDRTPQLDLARVELSMKLASGTPGATSQKWIASAAEITREMEIRHGAYWGRRAELILIGSGESPRVVNNGNGANSGTMNASKSTELDLLIRLADQAMRNNRLEDATKAYDRAAQTALSIGDRPQAFTLSVRASQALEIQQQHVAAANRMIELAEKNPDNALSSAVHLRGCWNWAQVPNPDQDAQQRFLRLMNKHLTIWPDATSANQVRIWLGGRMQTDSDWESAFGAYLAVSPTSEFFVDALTRAIFCAGRWVAQSNPEQSNVVAAQITAQLKELLSQTQPLTTARDQTLLAVANFGFRNGTIEPAQMVQPLEELVARAEGEFKTSAQASLIVALSADPAVTAERIDRLVSNLSGRDHYELVWTGIEGVLRHRPELNPVQAHSIAWKVVDKALAGELTERETNIWLLRKSDALANSGKAELALVVLEELEPRRPRDANVKLRIARLLTQLHESDQPAKALSRWRQLAVQLKPHTDHWYEAKYNVARLLIAAGKKDDARKVLEYLRAIPPGWNNSKLKSDFEELLAKSKQ